MEEDNSAITREEFEDALAFEAGSFRVLHVIQVLACCAMFFGMHATRWFEVTNGIRGLLCLTMVFPLCWDSVHRRRMLKKDWYFRFEKLVYQKHCKAPKGKGKGIGKLLWVLMGIAIIAVSVIIPWSIASLLVDKGIRYGFIFLFMVVQGFHVLIWGLLLNAYIKLRNGRLISVSFGVYPEAAIYLFFALIAPFLIHPQISWYSFQYVTRAVFESSAAKRGARSWKKNSTGP